MVPDPDQSIVATRRQRRHSGSRTSRRRTDRRPGFPLTLAALEGLAVAGAQVSVHIADLDRGSTVLTGDDFVTLPVGGLGVIPLLIETSAGFDAGTLDPARLVRRDDLEPVSVSGIWRHLAVPELSLADLAVLTAAQGDAFATNALLGATGIEAITRRMVDLGMRRSAVLDRVRDERGPDDAPHVSLGTTREYATLMSDLVGGRAVNPAVSAQVSEWLTIGQDLSLVGAATNLRAFGHDDDAHGLLFLNRTAYDDTGVRAEAGVIAGPRFGLAYALTVCFDDVSPLHRDRAHHAFRTLGTELMENVH
ncbi:serine hydrolase [Microbacterium halotolerans]|uniref:serine hydrolase n=1 Tax=Microbacterium halotolerans TaxID=246613 RepID=UPI001F093182|nr:serine hydrolase [Microbacterium halotolerans]